jgi:Outer membrane protein beta-barrel domain
MKKNLIVLTVMLGCAIVAKSQGTSFGVKVGLNLAKESASYQGVNVSTDSKANFVGGFYLTQMFTSKIGIQPELLYSGQGGQITAGGQTAKDKFGYLNIPILLRVQLAPIFNLHVGPQIGFLLSAKSDDGSGSGYQDVKSQYKSSDVGLAFGGGLDFPGGPSIGIRYIAGLSNIANDGSGVTLKNNVIQFTVGIKFQGK